MKKIFLILSLVIFGFSAFQVNAAIIVQENLVIPNTQQIGVGSFSLMIDYGAYDVPLVPKDDNETIVVPGAIFTLKEAYVESLNSAINWSVDAKLAGIRSIGSITLEGRSSMWQIAYGSYIKKKGYEIIIQGDQIVSKKEVVWMGNNNYGYSIPVNWYDSKDVIRAFQEMPQYSNITISSIVFFYNMDAEEWRYGLSTSIGTSSFRMPYVVYPLILQMIKPTVGGKIKCDFYCYPNHGGIDIDKTLYQTPVKTAAAGTIVKIDNIDNSAAGKWIWIYHGDIKKLDSSVVDKISTRYLHLDTIDSSLRVGQQVGQGTIIGTVGLTGATAPHLHFETRQGEIPNDLDYRKTMALDPLGFVDYPLPGVSVSAFSPVDIVITDPDGLIISKTINNFGEGADYFNPRYVGYFEDGEPIEEYDLITIDSRKEGDYLISVVPELVALPEDTYTLKVNSYGKEIILSENVRVRDIPEQPYKIRFQGDTMEEIIPIKVKIEPTTINLNSNGLISVFIEFFKGFKNSIKDINFNTIHLENVLTEKVNNVGDYKLLAKFKTQELSSFSKNDNYPLKIFGKLLDGTVFEGVDTSRFIKI